MQFLGIKDGSTLKNVSNHVKKNHMVKGEISGKVNSFHNQSLSICPKNYRILAKSNDGNIEAIQHKNLPWEGWMWHPERFKKFIKRDINRFIKIFK